jgi:hypothetical protein
MSNAQTRATNRLNFVPSSAPKPRSDTASRHSLSNLLITVFDTIGGCFDLTSQRRSLSTLDDRMLRDIGLSRYDVEVESRKPFGLQ